MKVIVTGGAGFIGSHVVDALIANGHAPAVVDDLSSGNRRNLPKGVPLHQIDIRDRSRLSSVFDEVRPDWVCHQAAQLSVSRSMGDPVFDAEVNILGLLNVLEQSARVGVRRIVFASSGGVLYGDVTVPATEDYPKRPVSPYGISKWAGEQYLEFFSRERQIEAVALRYSNVYGPRQNPHGEAGVVAIFTQAMLAGKAVTINGDGKYIRDYVYGLDVAQANVAALTVPLNARFTPVNIGTGVGVDVNELAQMIFTKTQQHLRQVGKPIEIPQPHHGQARAGDLRSNLVAPRLASQILGWKPSLSLDQGVEQTVKWFARKSESK